MSLTEQLTASFAPLLDAVRTLSFDHLTNGNMGGDLHIGIGLLALVGLLIALLGTHLIRPLIILLAGGGGFYLMYGILDLSSLLGAMIPEGYHRLTLIILGAVVGLFAALLVGKLMRFFLPTVLLAALSLALYPVLAAFLSPALAFAAIAVLLLFLIPTVVLLHRSPFLSILVTAGIGGYAIAYAVAGLLPFALPYKTLVLAGAFALLGIVVQVLTVTYYRKHGYSRSFSEHVVGRRYRW